MESEPFVILGNVNTLSIAFSLFKLSDLVVILITFLLLILSTLNKYFELSVLAMSDKDIVQQKQTNSSNSNKLQSLIAVPQKLSATVSILNTSLQIAVIIFLLVLSESLLIVDNQLYGFITVVLLSAILFIIFSEVIPNRLANKGKNKLISALTTPLYLLNKILSPISYFFVKTSDNNEDDNNQNTSNYKLSDALQSNAEVNEDKEILQGIIEFGNIEASEIMCSRVDVMAIELNTPFKQIVQDIINAGYSRIPVFEKSFDNVKGILYIKDLLPHINKDDDFEWQKLIRMPYFVPENKKINELLEELQLKRIHLAIVVDEYGGTSGIVTMEDILEEIVGEITDEFDVNEINHTKINKNNYIFEGKTLLNDFCKILDIQNNFFDEIKGDADTLAGFILELKGEFPKAYDVIRYKQFTFTIEEIDKRRIKKIKTTISTDIS